MLMLQKKFLMMKIRKYRKIKDKLKQKKIHYHQKNECYQNSSESSTFNKIKALTKLIKKLDILISQNQAIIAHFNIKNEEAKSYNKNLNKKIKISLN